MQESIFKAYDVRGIYGKDIDKDVARHVARIVMKIIPRGTVVIGHDGRRGSAEMASALLHEYAQNAACHVIALGLSSTPMFYFVVNREGAAAGIMVTASHNPKEYNGFKVVRAGAEPVSGLELKKHLNEIA